MLIDDDSSTNFINSKLLQRAGVEKEKIKTFESGKTAFEEIKLNPEQYDIIVLDLNMPGFSGIDFLRNLLDNSIFNVRVFISSSSIDPDDIYKCKAFPQFSGHLSKPIDIFTLQNLLI
jgi:CheY-like chemotaxis protein